MRFIGGLIEKSQRHPKRIVFPEGTEPRVLQAARQFYSLRLGAPILLGDRTVIKAAAERLNVSLEGVRIVNPAESEDLENFALRYELLRRYKGIKVKEAPPIKPSGRGRPQPPWRSRRQSKKCSRPILTANCRWTRPSCRTSPTERRPKAKSRAARPC